MAAMRWAGWVGGAVRRNWRKLALGCGVAGLTGLAFTWGRSGALCQTPPPAPPVVIAKPGQLLPTAPLAPDSGSDYSRRVVAYIHHNVPITREDLGEFLIARYGPDMVDVLINRKIVEMACQAKGITISDAEVEAAFAEYLRQLPNMTPEQFEKQLLKPRHTNLYQWKEDVIRTKLALTQFCRGRVRVTEDDVQKAFESRYGPKVKCRMILLKNDQRCNKDIWVKVHNNDEEFDRQARTQYVPELAAKGGDIPPICRHCGDDRIEKQAFGLRPGECSQLLGTPDGEIILKCVAHLPADTSKKLEQERPALEKELLDQKVMQEIPKVLKELREQAAPQLFFAKSQTKEDVLHQVGMSVPGDKAPPKPAGKP
jgi:hypothetical protein